MSGAEYVQGMFSAKTRTVFFAYDVPDNEVGLLYLDHPTSYAPMADSQYLLFCYAMLS